jgi:hypothetical protein
MMVDDVITVKKIKKQHFQEKVYLRENKILLSEFKTVYQKKRLP